MGGLINSIGQGFMGLTRMITTGPLGSIAGLAAGMLGGPIGQMGFGMLQNLGYASMMKRQQRMYGANYNYSMNNFLGYQRPIMPATSYVPPYMPPCNPGIR